MISRNLTTISCFISILLYSLHNYLFLTNSARPLLGFSVESYFDHGYDADKRVGVRQYRHHTGISIFGTCKRLRHGKLLWLESWIGGRSHNQCNVLFQRLWYTYVRQLPYERRRISVNILQQYRNYDIKGKRVQQEHLDRF